ncbi:MAG: hypothetical protein Q9214_002023 [Letrouitia sp. 1 TL-2023]
MAHSWTSEQVNHENLASVLVRDTKVKVAGVDIDGILRGKLMSKKKFLSIAKEGFGFCSVIYGWDMHDKTYYKELKISNKENGYRDMIAIPDLKSYRRIPWEDNVPFFLLSFFDPDTREPLCACPRGLLKTACEKLEKKGMGAMAGAEYEFYQFQAPGNSELPSSERNSSNTARFLQNNPVNSLPSLTEGMFGYSLTRPVHNQNYYYDIYGTCEKFNCGIESWHTESGPGVFEAALEFGEIKQMADKAGLFKSVITGTFLKIRSALAKISIRYAVKALGSRYGITPCFMAKPREGLPGNSGHMHVSIVDKSGKNLFFRGSKDETPQHQDVAYLSDIGRHFLAGLLEGLPDIMPILAPTVNSYKRLVENYWAPVTVSWGLEHRAASIRLITPPTSSPKATRFEIRVAGADANPFLVLAAILGLGWRGFEKKLDIAVPPLNKGDDVGGDSDKGIRLAKSLKEANAWMMRKESVAREVFGDQFIDHFGGTRDHEIRLWDEAVTDCATSAVFIIYDIFGLSSQAIQGADILAHSDKSHQYQVFMPDLFLGKPLPTSVYPPDTDEKKKTLGEFFAGPAAPPKTAEKVSQLVKQLHEKYPQIQKWGSLGMCWGGKASFAFYNVLLNKNMQLMQRGGIQIVSLTSKSGTVFSAAAEVHPAMVDPGDAKDITIPLCMLASGDENPKDVDAFEKALTVPKHVETFGDQVHGWMAAR